MPYSPTWVAGLTGASAEKAEIELGETAQVKTAALKDFKELIAKDPNFRPLTEDHFLLRFLRAKKYDVGRAYKTLGNYYAYKAKYSGRITDLTPRETIGVVERNRILYSPMRDDTGALILIYPIGSFDLDDASADEILGAIISCSEVTLELECAQVCGFSAIWDCRGVSARHLKAFLSPSFAKKAVSTVMDTWPCRVKGFHCVFEPPQITLFYNTFIKHMMPKKVRRRVYFHGENLESLHKFYPLECLPESLGI